MLYSKQEKALGGLFVNFNEIANTRQSCRNYDSQKPVEDEKINAILQSVRLAPSACNSQPYNITICKNDTAKMVAKATTAMGMNKFTQNVPVMIVISEGAYEKKASFGAKVTHNDYRSIDIGIAAAYLTAEATVQGLGSCILGWFDDKKIRSICKLESPVRLVIALGYAADGDKLRQKKRKELSEFVKFE